jgi:membrane protein implicated in regulation of membrane protease activity
MTRRGRIIWYGLAALLLLVGAVIAATIGSTAGQLIGFMLMGFALVLATSLVFYEVGLSEDRELERERVARETEARRREESGGDAGPAEHERPGRVRLPRSRGRRRRIS